MSEICSSEELTTVIQSVILSLKSESTKIISQSLSGTQLGVFRKPKLQSLLQLKSSDHFEQTIREIIMSYCLLAEKTSPGSFEKCLGAIVNNLDTHDYDQPITAASDSLSDSVTICADYPTGKDLHEVLEEHCDRMDSSTKDMFTVALELAGFGGRIIVEKSNTQVQSCELIRGHVFMQSPAFDVSVRLDEPFVICIDGYIESVAEINMLLSTASTAKKQILLFVRGLSDDVLHTLKVNYDRRTLTVIPIIVKFDIAGLNQLKDISVATNSRLFCSELGDLISSIDSSMGTSIKKAYVNKNNVTLECKQSISLIHHINDLKKRRIDETVDEKIKLFDDRIKSLTPNQVIIRLKDDENFITKSQLIDYSLRAIKSLVDHGTMCVDNKKILTSTHIASESYSKKCVAMIRSLGVIIKS